jgi:hypothetical protein
VQFQGNEVQDARHLHFGFADAVDEALGFELVEGPAGGL